MQKTPKFFLLILIFLFTNYVVFAGKITGTIKDVNGVVIPYASISVKNGQTISADANGVYSIVLPNGNYELSCTHVGFIAQKKNIVVTDNPIAVDFQLAFQESNLSDVVIQSKDPSNGIMKQTIDRRKAFAMPYDAFSCQAYMKMLMKTRKLPKRILFTKIEDSDKKEMGVDSAGKGIVYLSESISNIWFGKPDKVKSEVISSRESGSNGYGFAFPTYVNMYEENIDLLKDAGNKRGFISPVSDNAFHYYHFKYSGSFKVGDIKIHRIKVIPKRKFEPLFSGYISIVDNDWHIYSTDLYLTKDASIQLFDTVRIRQQYENRDSVGWIQKRQLFDFSINLLGIEMVGNVLADYSKYTLDAKTKFDNIVITFQDSSKNRNVAYWDSVRPVLLTQEETLDYHKKDSAFFARTDSLNSKHYRDSLRTKYNRLSVDGLLFSGLHFRTYGDSSKVTSSFSVESVSHNIQYNTVEGVALTANLNYSRYYKKNTLSIAPSIRYGFHNQYLNPSLTIALSKRYDGLSSNIAQQYWYVSGGRTVSQFNESNPISPLMNSIYTLFWGQNYMKIYEKNYANIGFYKRSIDGWSVRAFAKYENRIPIENTTLRSIKTNNDFTPNYPTDILSQQFENHQAVIVGLNLSYQPDQKYIQYPKSKESLGSTAPTYFLNYQKGINGILGSDVNYDKWSAGISNNWDWKLAGNMKYRFTVGGFLNNKSVYVQDMIHFNGNQTILANSYTESYQLAPYYLYSNTAHFYMTGHLEHHFNGLLTNKIPLFNRLHWFLVAGGNSFYINEKDHYVDVFAGLENLFKIFRVDFVKSFGSKEVNQFGVRIGIGGLF